VTRIATVLCLVVCLVAGAGCGGSTGGASRQAVADLRRRTHVDVDAMSNRFVPSDIVINPGTTVTWHNRDPGTHNIRAASAAGDFGAFFGASTDAFGPGATYSFTFTKPGDFPYTCTIHPGMTGNVRVAT
jgi:plastocyanin